MRSLLLSFLLVINANLLLRAQEFSREFGVVSTADAEMTSYAPDKSAEAVVLFDFGKSYFVRSDNGFDVIFERITRIKIFTDAGLKWAQVEIPFYQEGGIFENVYEIEGYTYNYENGGYDKSAFNVANCKDEIIDEFWKVKKFAMPDVKAGSIIEYRYKVSSQYLFNLRDWSFQREIPTIYSLYEVRMIPFYEYSWLLQGASKFDLQKSYIDTSLPKQFGGSTFQDMIHQYAMKDVRAFKDEEFITSVNDYIIKIDFQLARVNYPDGTTVDVLSTWPDLIKDLLNNDSFGKYEKKCEKLAPKLFNTDSLALLPVRDRYEFVLNYVKANYNWNGFNGRYAAKTPADLVKDKVGNCADINLFVVGLLNAAGVESYPVLLSTRDNGRIKYDYPYTHFFNYVLVMADIDETTLLADATEIFTPNDMIPMRCINDKGLLIKKDEAAWVSLECDTPSELQTTISISDVGPETAAEITIKAKEYDALYYRKDYGEDKKKILEIINSRDVEADESSVSVQNQLKKNEPYILKYSAVYKPEIVNEKIYIQPFLHEAPSDNPLNQTSRTFPLDMVYPVLKSYYSNIKIPEGYKVDFMPEGASVMNASFEMNYSVMVDGDLIKISFGYFFKNSVYPASDYLKLKSCFNQIIKKGGEKIVLTKI
jgi:transglutaminase-like putative cysteine protease